MADCLDHFHVDCPSRQLIDQIADKWSIMVLCVLDMGPRRFNEIKRRLEGVSQKSLTQSLRRLERNGLINRQVLTSSPVAVEYEMTPLGRTLLGPFKDLHHWAIANFAEVTQARDDFDARTA
ncbi:helix-turn-helix transcriptional regulator [Thioclava sp. BHET1]|nr:helix-turn-helix transcriptional regulator [Thioclava sp. BHET1]